MDDNFKPIPKSKQLQYKKHGTKTTADKWFSLFIRLRDINNNGYGSCITCSKAIFWKEAHAGHFITREKLSTRYNESNVNLQCVSCNSYHSGEQAKHAIAIDLKFGQGCSSNLIALSTVKSTMDSYSYKLLADRYREKSKNLAKLKGV